MRIATLKKRPDFLAIRGGLRWSGPAFLIEGKLRGSAGLGGEGEQPRFGFTVTKKLGNAVVRNRIRRRLKAAVSSQAAGARPGYDYVLVARPPAFDRPFTDLTRDVARALAQIHAKKA